MEPMKRDRNQWRNLALGGAASTILLVTRVFVSPETPFFRLLHPEFWPPSRGRLLHRESRDEEIERRLSAVETHLTTLPPQRVTPEADRLAGLSDAELINEAATPPPRRRR